VQDGPAELALQLTLIWLEDVADAVTAPGMLGTALQPALLLTVTTALALFTDPAVFPTTTS
jgi:hypothetical protein